MTAAPPPAPTRSAVYLAAVQFVFFTCWTLYVIHLPGLLESVGIARSAAGWVLLADQLLFAAFDVITGFASDRAFRLYGRVGPWVVAVTAVSCLAFLTLPWMAGDGEQGIATAVVLALIFLWAITSSALRSPAFAMLTRHVATPRVPLLAGLSLAGTGLAGAVAPYLGLALRGVDARLPFTLASLSLLALTAGLVTAERRAAGAAAVGHKAPAGIHARDASPPDSRFLWAGLPLLWLAALAFQVHFGLNAAPRYSEEAGEGALPWFMPVFHVGFSFALVAGGRAARTIPASRLFAGGSLLAAAGAWAFLLPGLGGALAGQFVAGLGWGAAVAGAFGAASAYARRRRPGREATVTGLVFSMLALAAAVRIGLMLAGVPGNAAGSLLLVLLAPLAWTAVGLTSSVSRNQLS